MVIRLTASCNNKCFFCMVEDEIRRNDVRPASEHIARIDTAGPSETIDIFGGEPTIDPAFWAVMEHALRSGAPDRQVTLATNVRLFSHRSAAERLGALGKDRLLVRTSLMGSTPELHDRLNGVRQAAFHQTVQGIRNLTDCGLNVQTNIVILVHNIDDLLATALVAVSAGSRTVKLSGAIETCGFLDDIAPPERIRERLRSVVPVLRRLGVNVKLEKLAPCLAPDFLDIVNREFDPTAASARWYRQVPVCASCRLNTNCGGAEKGMLQRFGEDWVEPIQQVPEELVDDVRASELDVYQPRRGKPFVRVVPSPRAGILEDLERLTAFAAQNPHIYLMV
jgi:uncharacterized Fe-S cluster-containing radical SAM superfamily protein